MIATLIKERRDPSPEELDRLLHVQHAVDIAMFGRMLANKPERNGEAAVQVAHAIGVHASTVEDDYFTAVDDLNKGRDESGAGHVGEAGFASAVLYEYICIDKEQLLKNLGNNEELMQRALGALAEAVLTVGPSGKQNSFASRAYVHYALAEEGPQQPRSLSLAFLKPVDDRQAGYGEAAIRELRCLRDNMDKVYGDCANKRQEFDVLAGTGSKAALVGLVVGN
jgi:CRISPR system Cascade subunit CasC